MRPKKKTPEHVIVISRPTNPGPQWRGEKVVAIILPKRRERTSVPPPRKRSKES